MDLEPVRAPELQLDEAPSFQKRQWFVERAGWFLLGLLVLAGAVGILGTGPFSIVTHRSGALEVTMQRYAHRMAPQEIRVEVDAPGQGHLDLWMSSSVTKHLPFDRITPRPVEQRLFEDRTVFVFAAPEGAGRLAITFQSNPNSYGRFEGRVGVVGGPELDVWQLIYP